MSLDKRHSFCPDMTYAHAQMKCSEIAESACIISYDYFTFVYKIILPETELTLLS